MKKNLRSPKSLAGLALLVLAAMMILLAQQTAVPRTISQTGVQPLASPASASGVTDMQSFWSMIQLGGGIGYLIIVVLAVGLFLALVRLLEIVNDARHMRHALKLQFATLPLEDMPKQIHAAGNSWLGQLLISMVNLYRISGSTQSIQQEISSFLQYITDQFDSFRGRMAFLSDSAGALGLLGTVWGMFLTFFGGNLGDSEKILNGMGVALVTTLIGLVVSLILNFSTTELFSMFNRRLDVITQKSDELRLRLLELERTRKDFLGEALRRTEHEPARPKVLPSASPTARKEPEPNLPPAKEPAPIILPRLRVLTKMPEKIQAGAHLPAPLKVQVVSQDGAPLPRQPVAFVITKGKSTFGDGERQTTMLAKENGEVSCDFIASLTPEICEMRLALVNEPNQQWQTRIEIVPGPPSRARIEGGNDQAGKVGQTLSDPLSVKVMDRCNNPVAGVRVNFRVALGRGSFEKQATEITKTTNANGIAEVQYTLGPAGGFNSVIAEFEGAEIQPLEFRALARG
ncbi:MAG: MotA/TolQ/ExbB proton channel family protein [candidate division KSB1 bacterium]|nr:MotA/TolQ/ExbB proton channel family protein [candidate division KSB1 bacterium]MDZ7366796.1 MotA/TolQ/ExbB proton channel family protein [candidate division KSB1 bacterium]MDZ7405197.1 MotA/TolQ/ExbB proton channel family protein [candidate division KSB1 bacterium]